MKLLRVQVLLSVLLSLSSPSIGQRVYHFCTTSFTRERVPGVCKPLVKCVRYFQDIPKLVNNPCTLKSGEFGVCCPQFTFIKKVVYYTVKQKKSQPRLLTPPQPPKVEIPPIKTNDINAAAKEADNVRKQVRSLELNLRQSGIVAQDQGPSSIHRHLQRSSKKSRQLSQQATKIVDASQNLMEKFALSKDQGTFALPTFKTKGTNLAVTRSTEASDCSTLELSPTNCQTLVSSKYRSEDGSCNNLGHPFWGRANTALTRLLPPDYEDGISLPRGASKNGTSRLPSPRLLSMALISHEDKPDVEHTLLLMQWGQFLDHDLTHTPLNKGSSEDDEGVSSNLVEEKTEIKCCQSGLKLPASLLHPECFPIEILQNDPFYGRFKQQCMEFVRSMPAERPDCSLGPREQVNQITSYLDGSNVYGSDSSISRGLRLGRRGRLRVTRIEKEDLLPLAPEECANHAKRQYCFAAGDLRCNEQIQLTVMHTVWLREHNRIASQLLLLNPHWDDDKVYQEARRIVVAEMQHITYNEWLPIILGMKYMDDFSMKPTESGFNQLYDPEVNPAITNAFATAAFRFGHSLVQGRMQNIGIFGDLVKSLELHEHQLSPFAIYEEHSIDGFVRGLATQPVQTMDASFSEELTGRLFQGVNETHGMDLVALNVQRGRDHGLPSYLQWRKICGLPKISSWREMAPEVNGPQLVPRLQRLYRRIEDVDLFIGAISEKPVAGSLLGPTFQCIVGDQFRRLRLGDRFWYEEPNQPGSFSLAQLEAIKEANLARILCDNSDAIQLMQPLAFKQPTADMNQRVDCKSQAIPRVDLSAWKE